MDDLEETRMSSPQPEARPEGRRHPSPPLLLLALVHVNLFMASLAVVAVLAREPIPSPFGPPEATLAWFLRHADAARWCAFLQFGAAIPLGLFGAVAASRLQFLGLRAAGVFISLFGGLAASLCAALAALLLWVLSAPGIATAPGTTHALHLAVFAVGGPGVVLSLGLLVAGVTVTSGLARLAPPWLMPFGLAVAVVAELSWISLVLEPAVYLIPVARLGAFVWLVAMGAVLPVSVEEARAREARRRPAGIGAQQAPARAP
jgi:hypothetical protein